MRFLALSLFSAHLSEFKRLIHAFDEWEECRQRLRGNMACNVSGGLREGHDLGRHHQVYDRRQRAMFDHRRRHTGVRCCVGISYEVAVAARLRLSLLNYSFGCSLEVTALLLSASLSDLAAKGIGVNKLLAHG